ncbi:unnamed protein product [Prorocentrum cordatum]|uniref:Uncharacterized protein n=1 Tax=Prorocentrum cordatum TaxID=2364126 RepID=A0ABN9YDS8_9DINO|nr:unnamed protein product [Polarella glacialis]
MQPANTLALGGSFEGATQAPGSPRQTPTASPRPYLTGPPNSGSGLEASKNARGGARAASKVRVVSHTKVKYGVPESPRESIDGDATAPPEKDASNPVPATAKVALLVLKFCANITASIAKKKGGEGRWAWRLRRIMNAGLMRRILRCIAMWDQFASKHLVWHGPPWRDGKTVTISGGCWQISQESVVTVSDVVDAMLQHMRSGAGADDLQGFVETYTKSSRRRLAVRSYGARDREARREARAHLQTGFRRVQSSTKKFRQEMGLLASDLNRANFSNKSMQTQEQNILSKEKATQMALRHGQVTSDAALATHRIFMFQQMARLQPSIKNVGRDIKGLPLLESPEQRDWQAEGTDWQAGQAEDGEASPSEDEEETRAQRLWRKVRRNLHILIKQKQNEERRRSSVGQLADVPVELRQRVKQVLRLNDAEAHAQRIVDLVQWRGVLSGTAAASTGKVRFAALLQVMNKGIIELQELVQTVTFEEEQVVQMQSDLQGIITDRIEQEEVSLFTQFARTGDIAEDVMQFVENLAGQGGEGEPPRAAVQAPGAEGGAGQEDERDRRGGGAPVPARAGAARERRGGLRGGHGAGPQDVDAGRPQEHRRQGEGQARDGGVH